MQFSRDTRKLLEMLHQEMGSSWTLQIIDLDTLRTDGNIIQTALVQKTYQRTFPNIFIGGKHLGGDSHLQELNNKRLLVPWLERIIRDKRT